MNDKMPMQLSNSLGIKEFFVKNLDQIIAIFFVIIFFFWYAKFGIRLAQGIYFDYMNLAFDFDPPLFIQRNSTDVNYKHPLISLFSSFSTPFSILNFSKKEAAVLVMALFGGLTTATVYQFSRFANFGRPEAFAGTIFFAVSSTPVFTSIIMESYGFSSFCIALVWCLFMKQCAYPTNNSMSGHLVAAILVTGATVTNIVNSFVAVFFILNKKMSLQKSLIRTSLFCMAAILGLVVILAILQPTGLLNVMYHPVKAAKDIYWLKSNTADAGLIELLRTYFVYSFFSPDFTKVFLSDDVFMIDFREFNFSKNEIGLVFIWLLFLTTGIFLGLKNLYFRQVAIPLILIVMANLILHLNYQFRGSIYLYAAHLHFPIFALSMGAAPWITTQNFIVRLIYFCLLLTFITFALTLNTRHVSDFALNFEHLQFIPDTTVEFKQHKTIGFEK